MRIVFHKCVQKSVQEKTSEKDSKFDYFKKKVLEHLASLQDKEHEEVKKAILDAENLQKAGYPVGTIREWKGRKYIKVAPNKWRPKYDSNSRGAKLSIAALKRKADACESSEELLQLILENRERFSDDKGRPLPFVKELSDYVSARNDKIEEKKDITSTLESKGYSKTKNGVYYNKEKDIGFLPVDNNRYEVYVDGKYADTNISGANGFDFLENEALRIKESRNYKGKRDAFGNPVKEPETKEKIQINETPEDRAQVIKTRAFNEEIERLTNSGVMNDSIEDAIKSLEKHKEWIHSGIPHDETLHEKATREGKEEATQSIIDKIKDGVKEIIEKFVKPSGRESDGISDIRKKYESSKSVEGNKKTVTLPDGTKIKCHYKLVEADAPTASHDEVSYAPTKGFPKNKNGQNINDRDYQNDKDAQESVRKIAANFNSLALESPPIVTKDGIVISGNNRTMSSKLAAKNGTDKAYLNDLRDMIDEYGLEESDLDGFKNPRLILEVDEEHKGDYTTEEFAQFNRDTKKTMSNVEKAVKLTKTLNEEKISSIASELTDYDTMSDLYNDATGCQKFVSKLIEAGIIGDNEKAQYCKSDGTLNDTGKDFVETVLVGSVLNENNIRKLDSAGGKKIRQKLVRAILPLIENKGNGKEYSFNNELNEAVDIAVNVAKNHDTFKTVDDYLAQGSLFGDKKPDEVTGKLAKLIHDEGEKAFANRMKDLGTGLQQSANGEMDIFIGGVESKQSLMEKFLEIKKSVQELLTNIVRKEQSTRQLVAEVLSDIA